MELVFVMNNKQILYVPVDRHPVSNSLIRMLSMAKSALNVFGAFILLYHLQGILSQQSVASIFNGALLFKFKSQPKRLVRLRI